jgi:alanine dehydrogenase
MVRVLPDAAVADLLDLGALLPVVADALRAQREGRVERPERPHFPVGQGLDSDDPDRPSEPGCRCPPTFTVAPTTRRSAPASTRVPTRR